MSKTKRTPQQTAAAQEQLSDLKVAKPSPQETAEAKIEAQPPEGPVQTTGLEQARAEAAPEAAPQQVAPQQEVRSGEDAHSAIPDAQTPAKAGEGAATPSEEKEQAPPRTDAAAGSGRRSRRDSLLDIRTRIKDVLKDKDRMDRAVLAAQVNAPPADFDQTVSEMLEAGELRDEEFEDKTLLYTPLTPDQEKRFAEIVATVKRADQDREEGLEAIRTGRLYKNMYRSWPDHYELDMSIDQWKDYRTERSVKKRMEESNVTIKCNRSILLEFAPLRKSPEAFVAALKEFQALPEKKRTVAAARAIVRKHKAFADDLQRLRRTTPDCTPEEAANLRFLRETWGKEIAADVKVVMSQARDNWNEDLTAKVQELVRAGRPAADSLLAVCQEAHASPGDEGMLLTARRNDLYSAIQGIRRLILQEWLPAYQRQEARKKLEREAKSLGVSLSGPGQPPPAAPLPPLAPPATGGLLAVQGGQVVPASGIAPPSPPPPPPVIKEGPGLYPEGIDLDDSLIVLAERHEGGRMS